MSPAEERYAVIVVDRRTGEPHLDWTYADADKAHARAEVLRTDRQAVTVVGLR